MVQFTLTGKTTYRKSWFSAKLILQVELTENAYRRISGSYNFPSPPCPPPPNCTNPRKWIKDREAEEASRWVPVRTFIRDATEEDMRKLALMDKTL